MQKDQDSEIIKLRVMSDITSTFDPKRIYAFKGDEVLLISVFGAVCIVENEKKERFSANLDLLSGNITGRNKKAAPGTAAPDKTIIHRAPVPKKKKEAPINQTNLF